MRIYLTSDLYLDQHDSKSLFKLYYKTLMDHPSNEEKYLICAGNICPAVHTRFKIYFEKVAKLFDLVFFVPGNYEYYGTTMDTALDIMLNDVPINVVTLHKRSFDIPRRNIRIVGATLWSDMMFPELQEDEMKYSHFKHKSMDFTMVLDLTPRRYYNLNLEQRKFIENSVSNAGMKDLIVITHFPPFFEDLEDFASDLSHLFSPKLKLWCHGNRSNDVSINGARVVSSLGQLKVIHI